jgi:hypothetical protein
MKRIQHHISTTVLFALGLLATSCSHAPVNSDRPDDSPPATVEQAYVDGTSTGHADGMRILSDFDANLGLNSYGGSVAGHSIMLWSGCPKNNVDCGFIYRRGMLLSAGKTYLAISPTNGAVEGSGLQLVDNCSPSIPKCTWTWKNGMLLNDQDQSLAIIGAATGNPTHKGAPVLTKSCTASNPACTWTLESTTISPENMPSQSVNAWGGGYVNSNVRLWPTSGCEVSNADCTWTFSKGKFLTDRTPNVAAFSLGGPAAQDITQLGTASAANNWTLSHGLITNDLNSVYAIKPTPDASFSNPLAATNICNSNMVSCRYEMPAGLYQDLSQSRCASQPKANFTTNLRGHVPPLKVGRAYGDLQCPTGWTIDFTYDPPADAPDTWISYLDDKITNSTDCAATTVRAFVWDGTPAQGFTYVGSTSATGAWKSTEGVCVTPQLNVGSGVAMQAGHNYRIAVQSYTEEPWQRRGFAVATAPVPTYYSLTTVHVRSGWHTITRFALPVDTSSKHYRYSLAYERLTDQGGDLSLADATGSTNHEFQIPYRNEFQAFKGDHGTSATGFIDVADGTGDRAALLNLSCPDFKKTPGVGHGGGLIEYNYLDGWLGVSPLFYAYEGQLACVLNEKHQRTYALRVAERADDLVVFESEMDMATTRMARGCPDYCNNETEVLSVDLSSDNTVEAPLLQKTQEFAAKTRACLQKTLGFTLPVPLRIFVFGEQATPVTNDLWNFGVGGYQVSTAGFQGLIRKGDTRIRSVSDLRYELHETTHVFTTWAFPKITDIGSTTSSLPMWFVEGIAIAINKNLVCDPATQSLQMFDTWRGWSPGATDSHLVGSEVFKRLEQSYQCGLDCESKIFRDLVSAYGSSTSVTNANIKAVMERVTGKNLDAVFNAVGLSYK